MNRQPYCPVASQLNILPRKSSPPFKPAERGHVRLRQSREIGIGHVHGLLMIPGVEHNLLLFRQRLVDPDRNRALL
jgi:hypothetical protein